MEAHFLQSKTWEKYEQLEGYHTFRLDEPDFSALAILHTTPVGNYLFCPYGPTLKTANSTPKALENSLKSALQSLSQLAKEQNAVFIRLEPTLALNEQYSLTTAQFQALGLHKTHDIDPAHTWMVDLTAPEAEILQNMRKSNVQYWRSHAKKGLSIRQTQDPAEISALTSLLAQVSAKDHFNPQDETHLANQLKAGFATLYLAEYQGQVLAASLVYDYADTRFYAHAATSDAERKLAAGTVLLVQMILDAKARGAKQFDFWGVTTSEDPKHPWYGFSQYKRSFGGHLVTYAGTWDYPIQTTRYRLYSLIRSLNRFKRKLFK